MSVDAVSGDANQSAENARVRIVYCCTKVTVVKGQSAGYSSQRAVEKEAPKLQNHDFFHFSEKSAAVVFENWNVFCFVKGDVRRPI